MAKLVLPRGLPASGKSTAIKIAVEDSKTPAVRVGRDFLRDQLFGTRLNLTREQEDLVSVAEKAQVEAFLRAGVDVYVDAMHLKAKYVKEWAKVAAKHGAELVIWDSFLTVALEECIRRDAQRSGEARLGEETIRAIHNRFFPGVFKPIDLTVEKPVVGEPYVPKPHTPLAYMVDIDGTCTIGPCDRSPYEWAKVGQDKAREAVVETVWALYKSGYKIIFCSGRDAVCRSETLEWLSNNFGFLMVDRSVLLMREQGDNRKDSIVKLELFDKYIRNNYNVVAVFDDRPQVIRMWNEIGLQVFDVAQSEEF